MNELPKRAQLTDRKFSRPTVALGAIVGAAVAMFVIATGIVGGAGRFAALSGMCGVCHEMKGVTATWQESSHVKVGCYGCHDSAYAWYDLPRNVFGSSSMLRRKVELDRARRDPLEQARSKDLTVAPAAHLYDDACTTCHTLNRQPSNKAIVIIDHTEHAERNDDCLSCHGVVSHPEPGLDLGLTMMGQCFDCHDVEDNPKASGECRTCHPVGFELVPQSHDKKWRKRHGKEALRDREQCWMCHTRKFCRDCHGLDMPHPEGWSGSGSGSEHTAYTNKSADVCARCHPATPDPCSTCHHADHNPLRGPWNKEHRWVVRQNGTASCMQCHDPLHCARCHEDKLPK